MNGVVEKNRAAIVELLVMLGLRIRWSHFACAQPPHLFHQPTRLLPLDQIKILKDQADLHQHGKEIARQILEGGRYYPKPISAQIHTVAVLNIVKR